MTSTIRALEIISTKDIGSPRDFAEVMWPDSMGWRRIHKVGHGSSKGAAMALAAGGFLGKLRAQGLITWLHAPELIILTDKGREMLKQADIPLRMYGSK